MHLLTSLLRGTGSSRGAATAVALVVVAASGCATKGDVRDLQTEMRSLTARQDAILDELERQSRVTVDTLRTQSDQIVDLRGNISQMLREILSELQTLRELSGQNQRTIASMRDQLVALQRSVRAGMPAADGEAVGGEGRGGDRPTGETAQSMFDAAMESFNRGSTRSAELGFRRFLQTFPDHELTPKVHYNLGDTYVQEERFEEAIDEFARIPERFPQSDQVPQALYRIGIIHLNELDNREEGIRYLERVVNTYPDRLVAELAQQALDEAGGAPLP